MTMMITTVGGLLDANNLYCSATYARRRFVSWKDAKILPTSAEVSPTLATLNPRLPPGPPKFGSSVNLICAFHARVCSVDAIQWYSTCTLWLATRFPL